MDTIDVSGMISFSQAREVDDEDDLNGNRRLEKFKLTRKRGSLFEDGDVSDKDQNPKRVKKRKTSKSKTKEEAIETKSKLSNKKKTPPKQKGRETTSKTTNGTKAKPKGKNGGGRVRGKNGRNLTEEKEEDNNDKDKDKEDNDDDDDTISLLKILEVTTPVPSSEEDGTFSSEDEFSLSPVKPKRGANSKKRKPIGQPKSLNKNQQANDMSTDTVPRSRRKSNKIDTQNIQEEPDHLTTPTPTPAPAPAPALTPAPKPKPTRMPKSVSNRKPKQNAKSKANATLKANEIPGSIASVEKPKGHVETFNVPLKDHPESIHQTMKNHEISKSSNKPNTPRRSSLAFRGKRLSSIKGNTVLPHATIPISEFHRHLDPSLPTPHKLKTLLIWICKRLLAKDTNRDRDQIERLLEMVNSNTLNIDWWGQDDVIDDALKSRIDYLEGRCNELDEELDQLKRYEGIHLGRLDLDDDDNTVDIKMVVSKDNEVVLEEIKERVDKLDIVMNRSRIIDDLTTRVLEYKNNIIATELKKYTQIDSIELLKML